MREIEFIEQLQGLLDSEVSSLDTDAKAELVIAAVDRLRSGEPPARCQIVRFTPGRRPIDEAAHPGLGSSDQAALILDQGGSNNTAYVLFDLAPVTSARAQLDVTLSFIGVDGSIESGPIPGWERRPLRPLAFVSGNGGGPQLDEVELSASGDTRIVLAVSPQRDLLPGETWSWNQLDDRLRAGATDAEDPYSFGHLFAQQVRVELRCSDRGLPTSGAEGRLFACDERRLGSLYRRLLDRLVAPDSERQALAAGVADPGAAFHPWYPVLLIGSAKAALYERALIGDIVRKQRNLTDPGWLLRIGLFLEFLTCLGVVEAVKQDFGDLLTVAERAAFERSELFGEIRDRINPDGWREVWDMREIAFPRRGTPRTGPVSARNLLSKRKATLAFLEVHHDDLKHAIELAGPNHHNAQETWQRVFRDAERAVLRKTPEAFPELKFMPQPVREFVLWHRPGQMGLERSLRIPAPIARLFGDQDGLYASACTQYRRSMNAVAAWSKARGLMDYTDRECIPPGVSLLESRIARPQQVARLQKRDGYQARLDTAVDLPQIHELSVAEVERLIANVPIFAMLSAEEMQELARAARPIWLGPMERLVVQGQEGSSLFVVVEGTVEVMLRREDGVDWSVDTMSKGAVVGEMSLLTGEPRSATVRAVDSAVAYEIGRRQYEPLLRARPQLIDELSAVVEERMRDRLKRLSSYDAEGERRAIRSRIRRFVTGE